MSPFFRKTFIFLYRKRGICYNRNTDEAEFCATVQILDKGGDIGGRR